MRSSFISARGLIAAVGLSFSFGALAQTQSPPTASYDALNDVLRVDWQSPGARTYFPQVSTDLQLWDYTGKLEFGSGSHVNMLPSNAPKAFFRLKYSDLPVASVTEAESADSDLDGLSNLVELKQTHTDPLNADTDHDGLPDGWEVAHGISPLDDGSIDAVNGPDGIFAVVQEEEPEESESSVFAAPTVVTNASAFAAGVTASPTATLGDKDGDGILDALDAGPLSSAIDWQRDGSPARFAYVDLPGYIPATHGGVISCNDQGDVIAEKAVCVGGAWHSLAQIDTGSPNFLPIKVRVDGRDHDAFVPFQPAPDSVADDGRIVGSAMVYLEPIDEEVTPNHWVTYQPAPTRMAFIWDSWAVTPRLLAHASSSTLAGNFWDEDAQISADGAIIVRHRGTTTAAGVDYLFDRYTSVGVASTLSYPTALPSVIGPSGFLAFNMGTPNAYSWLPGVSPLSLFGDSSFVTPNPRSSFVPYVEPTYVGNKPGGAGGYCINFWGKAMIRHAGRWEEAMELGDTTLLTRKGIAFKARSPNAIQVWKGGSAWQTMNETVPNKNFASLYTSLLDSTADGRVLVSYYGAGSQSGTGFLVPIDIDEVVSDQLAGNEANKLPTAFYQGAPNNPMLMAARTAAETRLAIKMAVPAANASSVRVGVRVVGTTTILGSAPAVAPPAKTMLTFYAQAGPKIYEVIAGYDANADSILDPNEVAVVFQKTPPTNDKGVASTVSLGNLDKIIVVTEADFVAGKSDSISNNIWGTDYTGDLISAFAHGSSTVDEATTTTPHSITSTTPGLSHPVGARWNSSFSADTHKVSWYDGSEASDDVKSSNALPQVLEAAIAANATAIRSATPLGGAWGNGGTYAFSISKDLVKTEDEFIGINELGFAFGKVTFTGYVNITSRWVAGGKVEVGTVTYTGQFEDLYDFTYWGGAKARQASLVQAGHATLTGPPEVDSGKVFFTKVVFNGTKSINKEY